MISAVALGQMYDLQLFLHQKFVDFEFSTREKSRQITVNAIIHGRRQNSRLPRIPRIRDFPLSLPISQAGTIMRRLFGPMLQ